MKIKPTAVTLAFALISSSAMAQSLTITVTNLSQGLHFTPILATAHNDQFHLYQSGLAATPELQMMAEGGDISGLASLATAAGGDNLENPAGGLLAPGVSTSMDLMTMDGNNRLSLTAMILPTNDGFIGLDSWSIPTEAGTYHIYINAYDAGTEANDEIINGGGAPGAAGIPVEPGGQGGTGGTGVTAVETNQTVHIHRGVLGDTDATGGKSDLDSRIHRWLNPVAKVTITVN